MQATKEAVQTKHGTIAWRVNVEFLHLGMCLVALPRHSLFKQSSTGVYPTQLNVFVVVGDGLTLVLRPSMYHSQVKRSTDDGATWSAASIVYSESGGWNGLSKGDANSTIGNCEAISDLTTGAAIQYSRMMGLRGVGERQRQTETERERERDRERQRQRQRQRERDSDRDSDIERESARARCGRGGMRQFPISAYAGRSYGGLETMHLPPNCSTILTAVL